MIYYGKDYYVDYINSDGQTIALLNRDNWMIYDKDGEELQIYLFNKDNKKQKEKIKKKIALAEKLIEHCIKHFSDFYLPTC